MSLIFSTNTVASRLYCRCSLAVKQAFLLVLTIGFGAAAFAVAPYLHTDRPFVDEDRRTLLIFCRVRKKPIQTPYEQSLALGRMTTVERLLSSIGLRVRHWWPILRIDTAFSERA